ncbi:MAG: hypothetical protein AAF513_10180 [Pseudomonadota bacterium]
MPTPFLDSSLVQPILVSSHLYRQYLINTFQENQPYISNYAQMEVKRSLLVPLIDFYFVLSMPFIQTVSDGFAYWRNQFRQSELKAAFIAIDPLFGNGQIRSSHPEDKAHAVQLLGRYIK